MAAEAGSEGEYLMMEGKSSNSNRKGKLSSYPVPLDSQSSGKGEKGSGEGDCSRLLSLFPRCCDDWSENGAGVGEETEVE